LNPRAGHPTYALSRGAPSATWVLLRIIVYTIYLAEREGFEPPAPFGVTGFQDQLHKPLGHLSLIYARNFKLGSEAHILMGSSIDTYLVYQK
jgi:hypothetical protein